MKKSDNEILEFVITTVYCLTDCYCNCTIMLCMFCSKSDFIELLLLLFLYTVVYVTYPSSHLDITAACRTGVHNLFEGEGHKQIWNQSGGPQRESGGCAPVWSRGKALGEGVRGQRGAKPPEADDILLIRL